MNDEAFWMVWNPARSVPSFRHESRPAAESEARRLARQQPEESFYVLRAETVHRVQLVSSTTLIESPIF